MKKFSDFLTEAATSQAADKAAKLGLSHVGYGYYGRPDGTVTHRSVNGQLIELSAEQQAAKNGVSPEQQQGSTGGEEEGGNAGTKGDISITFGRFNPPTVGHEKLIERLASSSKSGEYKIYPSRSQDPKKNPIDPETKVHYMRQMFPDHAHAIVNNEEFKTIFDVLKSLYNEGYSQINLVLGGDRVAEFENLAEKYNGKLYEFEEISVQSAGDRDPDSDSVEGMSASKMRKAAAENDFNSFRTGMPQALDDKAAKELFKELRGSMQVESIEDFGDASYELYEIAPKLDPEGLREAYYDKKIFKEGAIIENINSGITGKIVKRGVNYVIYIDEHDHVYRGWLKDLQEVSVQNFLSYRKTDPKKGYADLKAFNFSPLGLEGTPKLAKAVKTLTPGETINKKSSSKKK
tara:strand:- start:2811 stop:4025 length:1215 start_codon:yes stop_codon:yes gene_type:complete